MASFSGTLACSIPPVHLQLCFHRFLSGHRSSWILFHFLEVTQSDVSLSLGILFHAGGHSP